MSSEITSSHVSDILIVDDTPGDLKILMTLLKESGHQVRPASDGELALRSVNARLPELIILDVGLPGLDGYQVCQRLKTIDEARDIPVLFISASVEPIDKVRAFEAGGVDYITKPFEASEVQARVQTHLKMRLMQKQLSWQSSRDREARIKSEEQFRLFFENAPVYCYILSPEDRILNVNRSALQRLGYKKEELIGRHVRTIYAPETQEKMQEQLDKWHQTGDLSDVEMEIISKGGHRRTVVLNVGSIRDPQGNIASSVSVHHDITERLQAEEEKSRLEEQLRHSQKMEAVGLLAGGVAHDFNNSLCAITGSADLALLDLPHADPLREQLTDIVTAANRAAKLTQQLLAFSRKQVIDLRSVDLNHLIETLSPMLSRLIGENIILRTLPQAQLASIRADPSQMEQIVLNLAINARDAMPNGGELIVETRDVSYDSAYCEKHTGVHPGTYVVLEVRDTGCGMNAEVRARIFEPFFTTKGLGQGTGLGLATVFGIVEQNGGRIEVNSEPGHGSSFTVYLPSRLNDTGPIAIVKPPTDSGGNETLLVVEDEDLLRKLAVKFLKRRGYTVLAASAGAEALVLAEQHDGPIDLLLTDVVMPHMNGHELADKLQQARPDIQVLYTSGYSHNVIAHHGVLDEGLLFIPKPYTLSTVAARVREVLDQAAAKKA